MTPENTTEHATDETGKVHDWPAWWSRTLDAIRRERLILAGHAPATVASMTTTQVKASATATLTLLATQNREKSP